MPDGLFIIDLTPDDAPRYVDLRRRMLVDAPWAFMGTPENDRALDTATVAKRLAEPFNDIFAIERDTERDSAEANTLVAAVGLHRRDAPKFAHRAEVWGVFVEPAHRGRGLARALMTAAINRAQQWGVDYVDLAVSENSLRAHALYLSLGFEPWGREPATTQIGDDRYDEIYMCLALGRLEERR